MIRLAQVVRVNSASRTLDLVCLDNNQPIQGATMAGKANSVSGSWDVPHMPPPASQQLAGQISPSGRSMVAVVAMLGNRGVVLGFLPSQNNFVAFTDPDRAVDVHASGVVISKDRFGNLQVQHPGGATIRIGSATLENLADVAAGGSFPLPEQAAPTITVSTANLTLTIDPAGDLAITTTGNATVQANNATVNASQGGHDHGADGQSRRRVRRQARGGGRRPGERQPGPRLPEHARLRALTKVVIG